MTTSPKIYLIHAADVAIAPIGASFRANWPAARIVNLLEDSLMTDLAAEGKLTANMIERFVEIGRYCAKAGADAVLFTCSAFGPAIEECRRQLSIPVLKPNEAMYEELVAKNRNVNLLATFQPSLPSMITEIAALAKARGTDVKVTPHCVEGALTALLAGHGDEHNRLIVEAAAKAENCDTLAFAQFSMAPAKPLAAARTAIPILTTPDSAVAKLKALLA